MWAWPGRTDLPARLADFEDADAIVVVAGMEGALPSVVGGYVACPIIAVPTSIGYGANFGGVSALLSMLNSCANNVAVVNIDAGFKAGFLAGLIATRSNIAQKANRHLNDFARRSHQHAFAASPAARSRQPQRRLRPGAFDRRLARDERCDFNGWPGYAA